MRGMHNYLVCIILCLTFITQNLVHALLVLQKVRIPLHNWYYKHISVFEISDIYVHKVGIIFKRTLFYCNTGCVNPSLILTVLFSTYFSLYSAILRQIISTQLWEFLLALRLDHTCVTNMIVDKFLLLRVSSYLSIRKKKLILA